MKGFPKIGFGTWLMGGDINPNPNNDDDKDISAIKYAIKKGILHIDTAKNYANGKCEELVGEAIKGIAREKLFITTKVKPSDLDYDNFIKSCEDSLKRMGVAYIDLLYIHAPNENVPIEETARAFNELLSRGVIRNVGLSNVTVETIQKYERCLSQPVFAVQNQYNLIARESQIKGVIDYCNKKKIHFIAWRPIRYSYPEATDPYYGNNTFPIIDEMAKKYGKTNVQIAVKWLTQQEGVSILFMSRDEKHVDEILETENWELSKEDWKKLDKDFPLQKDKSFNAAGYFEIK